MSVLFGVLAGLVHSEPRARWFERARLSPSAGSWLLRGALPVGFCRAGLCAAPATCGCGTRGQRDLAKCWGNTAAFEVWRGVGQSQERVVRSKFGTGARDRHRESLEHSTL